MDPHEAFKLADAITITGTELMEACKLDESLPEEERGKQLQAWLAKD